MLMFENSPRSCAEPESKSELGVSKLPQGSLAVFISLAHLKVLVIRKRSAHPLNVRGDDDVGNGKITKKERPVGSCENGVHLARNRSELLLRAALTCGRAKKVYVYSV